MGELILPDYIIYRQVEVDQLGEIWEGENRETGTPVRIRKLAPFFREDPQFIHRFTHEKNRWQGIHHPSLLKLLAMESKDNEYYLIYELPGGVTLKDYLIPGRRMTDLQLARVGRQLLGGLEYLGKLGISHGNLCLNSIWYSSQAGIKTGDYGLFYLMSPAQIASFLASLPPEEKQTYAPEILRSGELIPEADIFSFGSVLYELATLHPFSGNFAYTLEKMELPEGLLHLLGRFLQEDPHLRFKDAGDAAHALEQWSQTLQVTRPSKVIESISAEKTLEIEKKEIPTPFTKSRWLWGGILALILIVAGVIIFWPPPSGIPVYKRIFTRTLPKVEGRIPFDNFAAGEEGATTGKEIEEETIGPVSSDTIVKHREIGTVEIPLTEAKGPYATPPTKKALEAEKKEEEIAHKTESTASKLRAETDYGMMPLGVTSPPGMIFVAGANVSIGSNKGAANEYPRHKQFVPPFYIDRYEVTNAQYEDYIAKTGAPAPPHWQGSNAPVGTGFYPVTNITWLEAYSYSTWAGKRLPTEYEWERMAQAINPEDDYPWGMEFVSGISNLYDSGIGSLRPIGCFIQDRSAVGAYDAMGNAVEWTSSIYQPYAGNTVSDPKYNGGYRVARGGSYLMKAINVRISLRIPLNPSQRYLDGGFRCARDIQVPESVVQISVPRYTFSSSPHSFLRLEKSRQAQPKTP
jgi:formylglycine-generating enzyme required for sulfatase activity/serine/threonine protein kinase